MSVPTERARPWTRAALRRLQWLLVVLLCGSGCRSAESPTGGETHFLKTCTESEQCGEDLSCLCGVCTRACTSDAECGDLPASECRTPIDSPACTDGPVAHCDASCNVDADCRDISASHRCVLNVCRSGPVDSPDCGTATVDPNEVLVIGDAFFGATHQITAFLEASARSSGALAVGERYRDKSSPLNNTLALGEIGIPDQYADAQAEAAVDVVIMNGGGADALITACATPTECPALVDAAGAAETLLGQMSADGVSHVVYAFYPDPAEAALRARVDELRRLLEPICAASPVPCHWLDLRATIADRAQEYLSPDQLTPTAAGAEAVAAAIWAVMRQECIAQ
jgi:hypothetical protein